MDYVFCAHLLSRLFHVSYIYSVICFSLYDESTNPTTNLPEYHYCWWPDTEWRVGGRSHKGRAGRVRIICLIGANETGDKITSERAGWRRRRAKDTTNQISIDHLQLKTTVLTERNGCITCYVGHNADLINMNELNWLIVAAGRSVKHLSR